MKDSGLHGSFDGVKDISLVKSKTYNLIRTGVERRSFLVCASDRRRECRTVRDGVFEMVLEMTVS